MLKHNTVTNTNKKMPSHSSNTSSSNGSLYQVFINFSDDNHDEYFSSDFMSKRDAMSLYKTLVSSYGDTLSVSYHKSKPIREHEASYSPDEYVAADVLVDMHSSNSAHSFTDQPFYGLHIEPYGRGYVVHPKLSHPDYGEKYYYNGWWNTTAKGWFFKADQLSSLIEMGAIYTPTSTDTVTEAANDTNLVDYDSAEDEDFVPVDLSSMVFMKYGKGFLLKPHRTYADYGEKYFHNGFWNAKAKGWFFKREYKSFLSDHGATFLHNAQSTTR